MTADTGKEMYHLVEELYPICRSITGNGVRDTLRIVGRQIPLEIHEVPSGTQVFDWTVPKEWNIADAYVKDAGGNKVIDFQKSNLHVVNYSRPVKASLPLSELKSHLFTIPDHPDWIPYRTSYYSEKWGFCLSHRQFMGLKDEQYEVVIDSRLESGHLTYGEYYLPGVTTDEVLISTHVCHPSLCNDNLSGIAVATFLAKAMSTVRRRYSYRFLFVPGTIGPITWLALNTARVSRIKCGLVLTGVGDGGRFTYKKSRQGNALIDQVMSHLLRHSGKAYDMIDFFPYGYDERQYCSPGFDLPVGCLMRTPHGQYPEYHTSADNLAFVQPEYLGETFNHCRSVLWTLETNSICVNQNPHCEPQLGKRGLYRPIGGESDKAGKEMALLWVLNLSDGRHSLLEIAERSGIKFETIHAAAERLLEQGLLTIVDAVDEGSSWKSDPSYL